MYGDLIIDWSKFKSKANGKLLEKSKNGYIEFCKILDEVDFELVGNYVGTMNKVELVYKFDESIVLNMCPDSFKRTYKVVINFKKELEKNNDKFIKFIGLTNSGNLISLIKTFDDGIVKIDTAQYNRWNKGRQDFYNKLKEVNGKTTNYYKGNKSKMNILINGVKVNQMSSHNFKENTYKTIINFKNNLTKNGDEFIKFVRLGEGGSLIAEFKTYDRGVGKLDIRNYKSFVNGRQDTYDYCEEKGYKVLSPYISARDKILIDFNCGHKPNWITPNNLKNGYSCPICNESKGEKVIREYLEKNGLDFEQECIFEDCKHRRSLPFDFYIQKHNLCIEFDGKQHFEVSSYFGEKSFKETQKRDKIKNNYCKENNINLVRIPYWEMDNIKDILDEEFERLRKIA